MDSVGGQVKPLSQNGLTNSLTPVVSILDVLHLTSPQGIDVDRDNVPVLESEIKQVLPTMGRLEPEWAHGLNLGNEADFFVFEYGLWDFEHGIKMG